MAILLFDSDPDLAARLAAELEADGRRVTWLSDARQAYERFLADEAVDLLMVGVATSGLAGLDLIFRARQAAGSRRALSILAMAAPGDRRMLVEIVDAGADDCVARPPDAETLALRLRVAERQIAMQAALIRVAQVDPLTGVFSRRHLFERAEALRPGLAPASVVMLDLDGFRAVNARLGAAAGDRVLAAVGRMLSAVEGVASRFGGDEFVILLPARDEAAAEAVAEAIRRDCADVAVEMPLTASLGVAGWPAGESFDTVLGRADAALETARAAGGNRVMRFRGGQTGQRPAPRGPVRRKARPAG